MIFAVLDVSLAVNLCINCSFLHLLLLFFSIIIIIIIIISSSSSSSITIKGNNINNSNLYVIETYSEFL